MRDKYREYFFVWLGVVTLICIVIIGVIYWVNWIISDLPDISKQVDIDAKYKIQWCYDQGGTARFDRNNRYVGCIVGGKR